MMTVVIQLIITLGIAMAIAATAAIATIVVRPTVIQGNENRQPPLVVN